MRGLSRRHVLCGGAAAWLMAACASRSGAIEMHGLPAWDPTAGPPPTPVRPGAWQFFTPEEGAAVEALVDRLIPPDEHWAGGKDAGCAVYIDRQLAGPFGESRGLYLRPPFDENTTGLGPQSPMTPAIRYRRSLAALDRYCHETYVGKPFPQIPDAEKDKVIAGLESGVVKLDGGSGRGFFDLLLQNTKEGFFADPLYGGNRDMVGWRMIGFPGARYDYRSWIDKHNEKFPLPPVAITGRPDWNPREG